MKTGMLGNMAAKHRMAKLPLEVPDMFIDLITRARAERAMS